MRCVSEFGAVVGLEEKAEAVSGDFSGLPFLWPPALHSPPVSVFISHFSHVLSDF